MPFLTRNENQSQVRYAAPARPMIATTGAPATRPTTPAPAAVATARVPLRLATTLLRWIREEAISRRLHHGMPPVKRRSGDARQPSAWLPGRTDCGRLDTVARERALPRGGGPPWKPAKRASGERGGGDELHTHTAI